MRALLTNLLLVLILITTGPAVAKAQAQETAAQPEETAAQAEETVEPPAEEFEDLLDRDPFDRITLDESNEGQVIEVLPIDFPERKIPESRRPSQKIRVRLLEAPESEFEVAWHNIEKIELYEQLVLEQAQRLARAKEFDEAYEYFHFLLHQYPNTEGLEESLQNFLYANAAQLFLRQESFRAFAVLEELYQRNPEYGRTTGQTAVQAIDVITDRLLTQYIERDELTAAREFLTRLERDYASQLSSVAKWRGQLQMLAAAQRDRARAALDAGKPREANDASRRMLSIWPELEGGTELALEVAQRYPLLVVGVSQLSSDPDPRSVSHWANRRAGALVERLLMEFVGVGPEGGRYIFPFGTYRESADRRSLTLELDPKRLPADNITGYDLASYLLSLADPASPIYVAAWAELIETVEVDQVRQVVIRLRTSHVLPEAFLQVPPAFGNTDELQQGLYAAGAEQEDGSRAFLVKDDELYRDGRGIAEIIERRFEDPRDAVAALRSGAIDVLDVVPPPYLEQLRSDESIVVRPYALPTLHLLVPNHNRPLPSNRTFRRSILYGIDREAMLDNLVLQRDRLLGYQLITGPFPAGTSNSDPLAYAYDYRLEPRPYNPQLAKTLLLLAMREVADEAERAEKPAPDLALVIGHPPAAIPRRYCLAIAEFLTPLGINCSLRAVESTQSEEAADCDFVYMEAMMWEPVVDSRHLLGQEGAAHSPNPYVELALRQLDSARNWTEMRERLFDLHRIAYSEVAVIPLWQTINYFAHRSHVQGVSEQPVTLYQNVDQWAIKPRILGAVE